MWHREGLVRTDISEESVASIFRVERISELATTFPISCKPANAAPSSLILSTLKMEEIRYSETLILTRPTRRHIPEDRSLRMFSSGREGREIPTYLSGLLERANLIMNCISSPTNAVGTVPQLGGRPYYSVLYDHTSIKTRSCST
jgi:hypothetical protein